MSAIESPWIPDQEQLAANLRHLRRVLDNPPPRLIGVDELLRAARLLCPKETEIETVRTAVQLAINSLPRGQWPEIAALLYGLHDKSRGKRLSERRQLAFAHSGQSSLDTFRTKTEPKLVGDLAAALIALVADARTTTPDRTPNGPSLKLLRPAVGVALAVFIGLGLAGYELLRHRGHRPTRNAPSAANRYTGRRASLEVSIYAGNATRHASWNAAGVTAQPNDVVPLEVFFQNQESPDSGLDAIDVRLVVGLDQTAVTRDHIVHITIGSLTSPKVHAETHILTARPSRLILVPNSVTWKHNVGSNAHVHWTVKHLSDFTIVSPIGTIIDANEPPANNFSETLVFEAAVEDPQES